MGVFSGIKEAQVNKGGVYLNKGNYLLEVEAVKLIQSRKKDDLFVVETKVIECDGDEANPEGTSASWIANLTKHDAAMGNVKMFLQAVDPDLDDSSLEAAADMAVGDDNPLKGETVKCQVSMIETRAGNPFSLHKWFHA